ncbi:MAG: hypothetical protein EYC70_02445 [Planctomycetota bacterium]|nr:MAG: hypothetical protein EYC70_02445 [Planctomycetota bacterium]
MAAAAPAPRRPLALFALLVLAACLSWGAREANHMRLNYPEVRHADGSATPLTFHAPSDWFSADPDGLYHCRRLERTFAEGLPPAETDPLLNYPEGARIPWPPYYTWLLHALLAPSLPAEAELRQAAIEHSVATLPMLFGIAASLLAVLAGWMLAGSPGALVAGAGHALFYGAIHYSVPGVGDHHAFVSLLAVALLLLLSLALARGALQRPVRGWAWGSACGAGAGLMLGTWAGALLYIFEVQLILAVLLFLHARRSLPGLAPLGLGFHLAALLTVLPAILTSPWKQEFPWIVVNLSWFHLGFLLVGALVFVPLPFLAPWSPLRKRYPFLVAGALLALAALLLLIGSGPAAGVREGFAWVSRVNSFMAGIAESEPLLAADRTGTDIGGIFSWLGFGVLLFPLAWCAAVAAVWRREEELRLLPWLVAAPLLLVQALLQRRFADPLALPMLVTLGWAANALLQARSGWSGRLGAQLRALPRAGPVVLGLTAICLAQAPTIKRSLDRLQHREADRVSTSFFRQGAWRVLVEWLALYAQERAPGSVLAGWDRGHAIEWVAGLPTVATNFGSYVGVESFRDPPRFLLATDPIAAEEVLRRRQVRYVLLHSGLADSFDALKLALSGPGAQDEPRWRGSLAERLMPVGSDFTRGDAMPVRYLRLVHVPPSLDPAPSSRFGSNVKVPAGWIWEYVPGAQLEVEAAELTVEVVVEYPSGRSYRYRDSAAADSDGRARLRFPWATDQPNGEGVAISATWSTGASSHPLQVPELVVLSGSRIELR